MNMAGMIALLHVAERVNPRKLDMRSWYEHVSPSGKKKHKHKGGPSLDFCGTSACWGGSAALDPAFRRATGVTLKKMGGEYVVYHKEAGLTEFLALMRGLEITNAQAGHLFGSGQSGKKKDLIQRWWNVVTGDV